MKVFYGVLISFSSYWLTHVSTYFLLFKTFLFIKYFLLTYALQYKKKKFCMDWNEEITLFSWLNKNKSYKKQGFLISDEVNYAKSFYLAPFPNPLVSHSTQEYKMRHHTFAKGKDKINLIRVLHSNACLHDLLGEKRISRLQMEIHIIFPFFQDAMFRVNS